MAHPNAGKNSDSKDDPFSERVATRGIETVHVLRQPSESMHCLNTPCHALKLLIHCPARLEHPTLPCGRRHDGVYCIEALAGGVPLVKETITGPSFCNARLPSRLQDCMLPDNDLYIYSLATDSILWLLFRNMSTGIIPETRKRQHPDMQVRLPERVYIEGFMIADLCRPRSLWRGQQTIHRLSTRSSYRGMRYVSLS